MNLEPLHSPIGRVTRPAAGRALKEQPREGRLHYDQAHAVGDESSDSDGTLLRSVSKPRGRPKYEVVAGHVRTE